MPTFPRAENDIDTLVQKMIEGYTTHAADFPNADLAGLTAVHDAYVAAVNTLDETRTQEKIAMRAKETTLDALMAKMKIELRQSEVDTKSDPEELGYIGWGPRSGPTPQPPPGEPRHFVCTEQGKGIVAFDWKNPAAGDGGPVRSYLVERRDADSAGVLGDWHQVGVATSTEVRLTDQPRGILLEYRVRGINPAGEGDPSVAQSVVL